MPKPPLTVLMASPRGFCAGVGRAIQIVETALERFGAPIYVRHEIVHNHYVVESLERKGAIFVEELDEVPDEAAVFTEPLAAALRIRETASSVVQRPLAM